MGRAGIPQKIDRLRAHNYFVAYIDILGARKFMKQKNNRFLNDLNSIYYEAMNDVIFTNVVTKKDIYIKIFSDNILIAVEVSEDDDNRKEKLEKIINLAGNFYNNILRYGYLARGAITEGNFYKDENNIFVYGKALTDAVDMEEENAIFPRIIVKKEIRDLLPQYFLDDNDYFYTLNTFLFSCLFDVKAYKPILTKMLQSTGNDNKINQKIMWVINYFNKFNELKRIQGSTSCQFITQEEIMNALNTRNEVEHATN